MELQLQSGEQVIWCSHVCIASTLAVGDTTNKQGRAHCVISLNYLRFLPIGTKKKLVVLMSKSQSYTEPHATNLIGNWRIKVMVETTTTFIQETLFRLILLEQARNIFLSLQTPTFGKNCITQRLKAINYDFKDRVKKKNIKSPGEQENVKDQY